MEPLQSVWENKQELRREIEQVEAPRVEATAVAQEVQNQQMIDNMAQTFSMRERLKLCPAGQLDSLKINMSEEEVLSIQEQQGEMIRENAYRERLEERKEKEKTQRRRANERLQSSGGENAYFQASREQMLEKRAQYLRWQKGEEQPPALTHKAIKGHEFDRDIQTGAMTVNIETLLAEKNAALAYIKTNQAQRRRMSPDELLVFQERKKVFELLDQTIESWYLANGINFNNGKTVSRRKQEAAKADFALLLERYQEGMANLGNAIGYAKIAQIHKTRHYKETYGELRETTKNSGKKVEDSTESMSRLEAMALEGRNEQRMPFENRFAINPLTQHDIVKIRDMIRNNEDNYHKNKKLIDQIYRDFLANAVKVSEMSDEQKAMSMSVFRGNSTKALNEAYRVSTQELGRQMTAYSWSMQEQMTALKYLLQGKETEAFSTDIYLHEHYGITTKKYLEANATAERIDKFREQGLSDEDIRLRLEREKHNREFHRTKVDEVDERLAFWENELTRRTQQAGVNPDADPFIADLKYTLKAMKQKRDRGDADKYDLSSNNIMTILKSLESEESVSRFHKKQSMFQSLMGDVSRLDERCVRVRRVVDKNTGEEREERRARFAADVINRDIVAVASPLFHEGELGIEAYIHSLRNIGILSRSDAAQEEEKQRLLEIHSIHEKTPEANVKDTVEKGLMNKTIDAAEEEMAMLEQAAAEIENYVQASGQEALLRNPPAVMSVENAYALMMVVSPLHEHLQGLNAHMQRIMKQPYFVRLPLELQQRYQITYPALNAYFRLSRAAVENYSAIAKEGENVTYPTFEDRKQEAAQEMTNIVQKALREELEQVRKKYPDATEESISLASQLRANRHQKEKSSLKFYDAMQKSGQITKKCDARMKIDIITGYRTDAAGNPLDAQEAAKKEKDERMLKAYYGQDTELTKEVMQSLWQELLNVQVTENMFTEQYILTHPVEMVNLTRKFLAVDNWRMDHKDAYESIDEKLRDKIKRITSVMGALGTVVAVTLQLTGADPGSVSLYTERHPTVEILRSLQPQIPEKMAEIKRIQNEE